MLNKKTMFSFLKGNSAEFLTGFTLLELLVVISIIGVLASMFVFSYSGWSDKARLANTKTFSQAVRSKLGFNVVGQWTFDDGTAKDVSGFGNDGTIYGATPVEGVMGGALSFNGTDRDYVNIADRPSLRISSGDMTISAWINFAVLLNKSHSIVSKWLPWIFFVSNGRLRFFIRSGSSDYSVFSNTLLLVNKWYHVVVVYTPQDRRATFYLDGKQDGAPTFSVAMNADSTAPLRIGYYGNASTAFQGLIDDVAIYKEAFTITQIQQLYVEGAQKRGLVMQGQTSQ